MPVAYEPTLRIGPPERLFVTAAYGGNQLGRTWDADPSGERFLMIRRPVADDASSHSEFERIDVVLNWLEELEERVPTD